jgi:hypothetical protein
MWNNVSKNTEFVMHSHVNTDGEKLKEFFDKNHIVRYIQVTNIKDWKKFISTGRVNIARSDEVDNSKMPFDDHGRAFKTVSGDVCYVSQPYKTVETVKPELEEWAKERGLEVDFYDATHSWYATGDTIVIVLHLPGVSFLIS